MLAPPPPPPGSVQEDEEAEPLFGAPVFKNAVVADTTKNSRLDHTFCGIYFPVKVKRNGVPLEEIIVHGVEVRGQLGEMSVYYSEEPLRLDSLRDPSKWTRCYGPQPHGQSWQVPSPLVFSTPVTVKSTMSFYVHSALPGDQAIIYDNARSPIVYQDDAIEIGSGVAHISSRAFEALGPWGGGAFRDRRAFVGRVAYSYSPALWSPRMHHRFPLPFRYGVVELMMIHRRPGSDLFKLPRDVFFHMLSFVAWDDLLPSSSSPPRALLQGRSSLVEHCPTLLQTFLFRLAGIYSLIRGQMF